MPTLSTLEAVLFRYGRVDNEDCFEHVKDLASADGIRFLCPKSFAQNNGPVGTHFIQVYFTGSSVPAYLGKNKSGQTVRWTKSSGSLADLSLSPSIQEESDCGWHGWVGNAGVPPGSAA